MRTRPTSIAAAAAVSLALLATACGTDSAPDTNVAGPAPAAAGTEVAPPGEAGPQETAASTAEANLTELVGSDDVRLIEVLEVDSGDITTISDTVDGDRPVLLWFWAPH